MRQMAGQTPNKTVNKTMDKTEAAVGCLLGAGLVWMMLPMISKISGAEVPWPWAWVALPLFLDVYCLGAFVLALFGFVRKVGPAEQDKAAGNVAAQEAGKAPDEGPGHAPDDRADAKQGREQSHGQN